MIDRRSFLGASLAVAAGAARAQGRVMRIVIPFAAGGVQDILARSLSNELGAALGASVIVENRAGAGGTIGTAFVAKAAPDGNTLVLAAASHNINGSLHAKLAYDPQKDFTPIAHIGNAGYVLMLHPEVPAKTAGEYIRYARANPGKLNYATAGIGSATHLSMAYFNGLAGIDVVHVPLKATGEAVNEVLSGRAQAVIAANIGALPFANDKRIRLVGVTSGKRSKFLPGLPTIAETLPGYQATSWYGVFVTTGTPESIIKRLYNEIAAMVKRPEMIDKMAGLGIEPEGTGPQEFVRQIREEHARWARTIKLAKVPLQ